MLNVFVVVFFEYEKQYLVLFDTEDAELVWHGNVFFIEEKNI